MNPILAANLVSLGRDFLQTTFSASSDAIPADSKAFQGMLSEACERKVAGASELSTVLDRLGVTTLEEVSEARERLKIDLLANPEVAAFRETPYSEAAVRLRGWDDQAKQPGLNTPPLEHFLELVDLSMLASR